MVKRFPIVIAAVTNVESDQLVVSLSNIGLGPAVRVVVSAMSTEATVGVATVSALRAGGAAW